MTAIRTLWTIVGNDDAGCGTT